MPTDQPWCVVVVLPESADGDDWVAGTACADDAQFRERGVRVSVSGRSGSRVGARLLPDDFAGALDEDEWRAVGPNLAVPAD